MKNSFPYFLATGDLIKLSIAEWTAAFQAKTPHEFIDLQFALEHMKKYPDEWEGDVFPILVLVIGGIDIDLR